MKRIIRLTESDLTRIVKKVLNENVSSYKTNKGEWNYKKIESSKSASDIAELLIESNGGFLRNDYEAVVQSCFNAMSKAPTQKLYYDVANILKKEPLRFIDDFIGTLQRTRNWHGIKNSLGSKTISECIKIIRNKPIK